MKGKEYTEEEVLGLLVDDLDDLVDTIDQMKAGAKLAKHIEYPSTEICLYCAECSRYMGEVDTPQDIPVSMDKILCRECKKSPEVKERERKAKEEFQRAEDERVLKEIRERNPDLLER